MQTMKQGLKNFTLAVGLLASSSLIANQALQESLNQSLGDMLDSMEAVQELNGEQQFEIFGNMMKSQDNVDSLKAMGKSINYPENIKTKFDASALKVIQNLDVILKNSEAVKDNPQCANQMAQLKPEYLKIKSEVEVAAKQDMSTPEAKAKAYIAVLNAMPLSMIASKISIASMMTCGLI